MRLERAARDERDEIRSRADPVTPTSMLSDERVTPLCDGTGNIRAIVVQTER